MQKPKTGGDRKMTVMRDGCRYAATIAGAIGVATLAWSYASWAQAPSARVVLDNMKCSAANADPETLRTGSAVAKNGLLTFGLPCQETVNPNGPDPTKTSLENLQLGFDFYSWLTFIALNSPQTGSIELGKPDTRTKWEDPKNFIQLLEVMRSDVKNPSLETKIVPPNCLAVPDYKPDMMIVKMIEETYNQPFKTGPLIDQQRNYALFDILMNKQMFDYIVKHGLYSREKQRALADLKIDFPAGHNADELNSTADVGAVMIKVSWKILEDDENKSNFHTVDALVSMPMLPHDDSEPPCLRKTLGLVGFHVGHKTVGRLQWIWTSFEHVDNVPEQKDIAAGKLQKTYNFYDPSCDVAKCPVNEVPPQPWEPERAKQLKFHNSFNSQIARVVPLTDATKDLNHQFQTLLSGTVWKNYMLLSTQWPSGFNCARQLDPKKPAKDSPLAPNTDFLKQPDMTCEPAPTFLANSTLETYSQGTVPLASSSCMSCHANATSYQRSKDPKKLLNQSDFTFMLEKAFSEKPKPK